MELPMRRWSMPRWWHFLHVGIGAVLLVGTAVLWVGFDVHDPWSRVEYAGLAAASVVCLLAGAGFGVELERRRLDGQRLAGVGTAVLGVAMIANQVPDLTRGAIALPSVVGVLGGLLIVGFGVGALYRPTVFGAAARDEAV